MIHRENKENRVLIDEESVCDFRVSGGVDISG